MEKKKILVLCTGNSCRSQMAHGFLQQFAEDNATVYSAGVETHGVNPLAVRYMQEAGFNISHHTSNHLDEYRDIEFDFLITVCDHAQERCPLYFTKAKTFHHNFSDPSKKKGNDEEVAQAFRQTRDEIKLYCENWVKDNL